MWPPSLEEQHVHWSVVCLLLLVVNMDSQSENLGRHKSIKFRENAVNSTPWVQNPVLCDRRKLLKHSVLPSGKWV